MSKLLIVDNSTRLLEVMKRILEPLEYTIMTLNRTENIYEEIRRFQPDLLVLDIYLHGEDGREICKKIKINFATKHLPVILFSAFPKALEEYKSCFADDFIEKPFDIKTLVDKIKSVLNCRTAP